MGLFFDNFPYTNFHEINLDWIMQKLGLLNQSADDAKASAEQSKASAETAADQANNAGASAAAASQSAAAAAQSAAEAASIAQTGRRYIFIGDSYADGWDPETESTIKSWVGYIKDYLGVSGNTAYEKHAGGAGFTVAGQTGYTFAGLLTQLAPDVTDPATITDIIVLGGYNDRNNYNTIVDAVAGFKDTAKNLFPRAIVRIGWVGRNVSTTKTSLEVNNLYRAMVKYTNSEVAYLTGVEYAARAVDQFFNDGIHPNTAGQVSIAQALYHCLTGGASDAYGSLAGLECYGGEISFTANVAISGRDIVWFNDNQAQDVNKSGNCDGAVHIDCGVITKGPLLSAIFNAEFRLPGLVTSGGTAYAASFKVLVREDNHLVLFPYAVKSTGWVSGITNIRIFENTLMLPASWF